MSPQHDRYTPNISATNSWIRTHMNKTKLFLVPAFLLLTVASVLAGEPVVWEMGSRTELLKGEARGVSITDTGVVTLAPNMTQLFNTEQAYVWASAVDKSLFRIEQL